MGSAINDGGDGNGRGSVDRGPRTVRGSSSTGLPRGALERVAPGEVDVSLEVETRHLNLAGTLHGG